MFEGILRGIQNRLALKSHFKAVVNPPANLAIGGDDEMSSIPLLIFTQMQPPPKVPSLEHKYNLPYEALSAKGAGDTLSTDDFVTDNFNLGDAVACY